MKKEFTLVDKNYREVVDLRKYKSIITKAYKSICSNKLTVTVKKDCYIIGGYATNYELRMVGHFIASNSGLGKFSKKYGNSTQVFRGKEI